VPPHTRHSGLAPPSAELIGRFTELMFLVSGIRPGPLQENFIEHRLRRRIREVGLESFEAYYEQVAREFVTGKREELEEFIDLVTTHETRFLRTPPVWEYLAERLLVEWWDEESRRGGEIRPFQVWSGAAASGEEAFTIAMVLDDFQGRHPRFQWDVKASDLSLRRIRLAQDAVYPARAIPGADLNAQQSRFLRYFQTDEAAGSISVDRRIREKVGFFRHNLLEPAPFLGEIDLALIRNVLMYFEFEPRKRVLENVARALRPGGHLILGEAESLLQSERLSEKPDSLTRSAFEYVVPGVYRRTGRTL
jgi:chemotaxis protein methyltransferase CheR